MSDQPTAAAWLNAAVEASNAGRHPDAEAAFGQALAIDPDLGDARLGLGLTWMATRRFDEAVASLRLATASGDAPALWETCLAQALYMTGDFAGSAETFERAAHREPLGLNARRTHAGREPSQP